MVWFQVRRMLGAVHLKCVALERLQIATLTLGNLGYGQWRSLLPGEVLALYDAAGGRCDLEQPKGSPTGDLRVTEVVILVGFVSIQILSVS